METLDFLFDGACRKEMIYCDGVVLTYAICTVCGLLLDGWVPPRVKMEDVVGACEIESESASLEGYDEYGAFTFLELLYELLPFLHAYAAVDVEIWHFCFVECFLYDGQE